jgi:hypothetical protein
MQAQGGAAIGQGIVSLGQSIGSGIAQGRERKEKMAERDRLLQEQRDRAKGTIKQGNAFAKGMLALDLPPEVKAIFENYSKEIADNPNISLAEQQAAAEAFISQAPTIITLGLGEAKRQTDLQNNRFLQEAISMNTVAGTGEIDIPNAARTAVELGAAPDFVTQQLQGFEGLTPKTPTPTEAERNARAVVAAQVAAGLPPEQAPALYAQVLGGPAAVTQATIQKQERDKQADEAKVVDEQKKQAEALESTRYRIDAATDTIDKAISLSRLGAGGPLQGLPGVRDISAIVPGFVGIPGAVQGGGRSKILASYLDTLKATLTIETQKELKRLSATGASGFGPLTEKEGQLLASSVASLDASLPEKTLRENLEVIRGLLAKMRGSTGETETPQTTGASQTELRPLSGNARKFLEGLGSPFSPNQGR